MIELYSGTPGSGKSLHAASVILKWSKKRPVVLNYDINLVASKKNNCTIIGDNELTPSFLIR